MASEKKNGKERAPLFILFDTGRATDMGKFSAVEGTKREETEHV